MANFAIYTRDKALASAAFLLLIFCPVLSYAQICSTSGYTIVFINGIGKSQAEADVSALNLEQLIDSKRWAEEVTVHLGYNATHLGGAGDLIQSVTQAFHNPVSQFDLNTILMQIHPEVTTRKILLVGHSQGSFYTNEMYKYLTDNGVPQESIGVYHIATPAVFVAGGGQYVTSDNDKLINKVRNAEVGTNVNVYRESRGALSGNVVSSALRANISIPKEPGYDDSIFGGHKFQVYMNGAGDRIARDIQAALSRLKASEPSDVTDGCFTPPSKDVSHQMKAAVYAVADPLASLAVSIGKSIIEDAKHAATFALSTRASGSTAVVGWLSNFRSPNTSIAAQTSAAAESMRSDEPQESPRVAENSSPQSESRANAAPAQSAASAPLQGTTLPPPPKAPESDNPFPQLFALPSGMTPGFGGGGGATAPLSSPVSSPIISVSVLRIDSPVDNAFIASTTVQFSGIADPLAFVYAEIAATSSAVQADAGGAWRLSIQLPEGLSSISFSSGNSSTSTRSVTIDITPPATSTMAIAECAFSLATSFCLVPTNTVSVSWISVPDASTYSIVINGGVTSAANALSGAATLAPNATNTISVVAYDAAGNAATSSELSIRTVGNPLIINEVGWAGIESSANQWVEIKNVSPYALELANVSLARTGAAGITLSGTVPAHTVASFSQNNAPFPGLVIAVDPFPSFSTTTAEQLSLVWNGVVLDATPAESVCTGWCAGSWRATLGSNVSGLSQLVTPLSMERISSVADGVLASSWRSTDSYGSAVAPGQGSIWGTPGRENSAGHPVDGVACGNYANLAVAHAAFNPSGSCYYLTKFVTGLTTGANRYGVLHRGVVGSSTPLWGHLLGKGILKEEGDTMPGDAFAGEEYFFALFESRSYAPDVADFTNYFKTGVGTPPHGNYVTIPFTYQP